MFKESKYNIVIDNEDNGKILLYNTITGSVCFLNKDVYFSFHNKDKIDFRTINPELIRLGFVVNESINETNYLEICKKSYIFNSKPSELSFVIAPTLACNYHCQYCFESCSNLKLTMSDYIINKVIDFIIRQCEKYKCIKKIFVLWFGGEPTLHIDLIVSLSKALIEYADKQNIVYDSFMATNGSLLTLENTKLLKKYHISGVQITLDGLRQRYAMLRNCRSEDYDIVLNNICVLSEFWNIHIRFNITKDNKNEIKQLIDEIILPRKCGKKLTLYFSQVKDYIGGINIGLDAISFENIRNELIEYLISHNCTNVIRLSMPQKVATACGAMRNYTCVIGPGGELYRCEHCLGKPNMVIGTVEDGFYRNNCDMMFLNYETPQKCLECNLLPVCAGGCLADRLLHNIQVDCEAYRIKIINNVKRAVKHKQSEFFNDDMFYCC